MYSRKRKSYDGSKQELEARQVVDEQLKELRQIALAEKEVQSKLDQLRQQYQMQQLQYAQTPLSTSEKNPLPSTFEQLEAIRKAQSNISPNLSQPRHSPAPPQDGSDSSKIILDLRRAKDVKPENFRMDTPTRTAIQRFMASPSPEFPPGRPNSPKYPSEDEMNPEDEKAYKEYEEELYKRESRKKIASGKTKRKKRRKPKTKRKKLTKKRKHKKRKSTRKK